MTSLRPRSSTTPRRRLPAADRRAAILRSALDVFGERGFNDASLDEVAAHAGISKALIYEHFTSKRRLQQAALETCVHDALDRIAAATETPAPLEDQLRAGIAAFLAFVQERPAAWRLISRNATDPDTADAIARLQDQAAGAIGALIATHAPVLGESGSDLEQAVDMLARLLSGALQALASWWIEHPDVSRDRAVGMAMDLTWVGLDRVSAGERWAAGSNARGRS